MPDKEKAGLSKIFIAGAASAIAQATARLFAEQGASFFLVARDEARLKIIAEDLKVRGAAAVEYLKSDLNNTSMHKAILERAVQAIGALDAALICHGVLGSQKEEEHDFSRAEAAIRTNFISAASLLTELANYFEGQRRGCIGVISSVAGDRGRKSNYVYGSAKAALSVFTDGLRNRLAGCGVTVLTIKPGFVDTPMTAHLKKGALFVPPERVAKDIKAGMLGAGGVLYTPWFWRPVMCVIKSIPEAVFKRLSL